MKGIRCVVLLVPAATATAQLDWQEIVLQVRPAARHEGALTIDPEAGLVLFGGSGNGGVLGDTWRFSGGAWLQLTPPASPPARYGPRMATDFAREVVVLFGGFDQLLLTPFGDTWEWDGTTWVQRSTPIAPSARSGHAMAYDAVRARTVLFGGNGAGPSNAETWEWDGSAWAQRAPLASPPAQSGHSMACDQARGVVVMAGSSPAGGTYEWDGTTWAALGPCPAGGGARITYDMARERVVWYGGADNNGTPLPSLVADWDGQTWTPRTTATSPPPRYWHMLAYDPSSAVVVAFGGRDDTQPFATIRKDDTWVLFPTAPASAVPFGAGCGGSQGVLRLDATSRPWIDSSFDIAWDFAPPGSLLVLALGLSDQTWAGQQLPLALGAFGMPGCSLLMSVDETGSVIAPGVAFTQTFAIPSNPGLLGQQAFLQGFALDPPANAAGAVASNGLALVFGAR